MKFTIANTSIRTDVEGRYCLNDLHKAAGGENRHRPSLWVENQQTKDLIAEIDKAGIPAIHSKQGLGTFVCKELVYSFAMWISPAFHLQVIRAYDSTAQGKAAGVSHQGMSRNRLAASVILLRAAAEDLKLPPSAVLGGYKKLEAELGVSGLLPDYAVDAPSSAVAGSSEVTKAAGELLEDFGVGISTIAFNRLLVAKGFLAEHERPSSKGGTKKFKSVINLDFGKNVTSPSNPRETQPHWYVSKFAELLELVMPAKPRAA